tara:strand:- start:205 stop:711 length:507 start_codon:yes stop_codon:yes gene_type:complete
MDVKIFDNFLSSDDFATIKNNIFGHEFPWYYQDVVAYRSVPNDVEDYYHAHILYQNDRVTSTWYENVYNLVIPKIREVSEYHSLIRIKVNSYAHSSIVKENEQHVDYDFFSYGGILSLNTCNGFTRLSDDSKIDSVENRFHIFDSSKPHNSSTTSDCKRRVNINFNWN